TLAFMIVIVVRRSANRRPMKRCVAHCFATVAVALTLFVACFIAPAAAGESAEATQGAGVLDPCLDSESGVEARSTAERDLETEVKRRIAASRFDRMTDIDVGVVGTTICLRGTA